MHNLKIAHDIARANHLAHQQKNKNRHDAKVKVPEFKIGDKVLFKVNKVPTGMSSKLHDKSDGPFRIVQIGPNYTYKLVRCDNNKAHPSLVNATNLKVYHDPKIHRQKYDNLDQNAGADIPAQANQPQQVNQPAHVDQNQQVDQPAQAQQPAQADQPAQVQQPAQADPPTQVDPNKKWKFKKNGKMELRVE